MQLIRNQQITGGVIAGLIAGLIAIAWVLIPTTPILLMAVIALPIACYVAWRAVQSSRWLEALFILAVTVAAVSSPLITAGGLNLRLSQALLPIVLTATIVHTRGRVTIPPAFGWAILLLAIYSLFTFLNPITRTSGISQVILLILNLAHFLVTFLLAIRLRDGVDNGIRWLGWGSILIAVWVGVVLIGDRLNIAIFQSFFFEEGLMTLVNGELVGQVVRRFGYGLILGGFFAGFMVLFLVLQLEQGVQSRRLLLSAALASLLGMMFSFGRGPLLSAVIGLAVFLLITFHQRLLANIKLVITLAALSAIGLAGLTQLPGGSSIVSVFLGRAIELLNPATFQTGTVASRNEIWQILLDDMDGNVLIGKGGLAYRYALQDYYGGASLSAPPASENILIEMLHSSGLIGLGAYIAMHITLGWGLLRTYWSRQDPKHERWRALALFCALSALFAGSVTNPFAWNALYWTFLGIVSAAVFTHHHPVPREDLADN